MSLNSCKIVFCCSVDLEQAVSAEAENVITLLIQKHIPAAVLRCQKGHELTYMLPVATPEKFPGNSVVAL